MEYSRFDSVCNESGALRYNKSGFVIPHRYLLRHFLAGTCLLLTTKGLLLSQSPSPRDILVRFCDLDARGELLSPEGWERLAALFTAPGAPRHDEITVVRDFVVGKDYGNPDSLMLLFLEC